MPGITANYEYWGNLEALTIHEIACLMSDIDPRALADITDSEGDALSFDEEIELIRRGLITQKLDPAKNESGPFREDAMILKNQKLFDWLRKHGFDSLAESLSSNNNGGALASADWIGRAIQLANETASSNRQAGVETSARAIAPTVARMLAKDPAYHGNRGPRSADDIRNRALRGWKFMPPKVD